MSLNEEDQDLLPLLQRPFWMAAHFGSRAHLERPRCARERGESQRREPDMG